MQTAFDTEAYLVWEETLAEKHEYLHGEVFAMVGARREHVSVSGNLYAAFKQRLRTEFYRVGGGYLLRFPELADFEVSADGLEVTCVPAPDVSKATSQHFYLNHVLPLVLSKLGKLVFHASAVEVEGCAFAAESGRGKPTLAASSAVSVCRFMTSDDLVVESVPQGFEVLRSRPSIRLWADSEEALIAPGVETVPALSFSSKSRFLAGEGVRFCDQSRPLRRVYFLGNGSAKTLEFHRLSPAEALVEWVKHSFLLDIEEQARLASHFDQVAALANQPIHYRLDFQRRFQDLASVRQAIVENACNECVTE